MPAAINELMRDFTFTHWQIAIDGIWENAIIVPSVSAREDIDTILASSSENIAFEAFFKNAQSEVMFLGIRIQALPPTDKKNILYTLLDDSLPHNTSLTDILNFIEYKCGLGVSIDTQPDFLELGFEGFWKSKGSYIVWKNEEPLAATPADIATYAPQLLEPFERAVMMEMAWKTPLPHWLALQISSPAPGGFVFSSDRYKTILDMFL